MGFLLVPLQVDSKDPEKATLMALDLMDGFGKYAKTLKQALQGETLDPDNAREVEKAGYEAMTAIMTMLKYLNVKLEEQERTHGQKAVPGHCRVTGRSHQK